MTKDQFETAVNMRLSLSEPHYMFIEQISRDSLDNIKPDQEFSMFFEVTLF